MTLLMHDPVNGVTEYPQKPCRMVNVSQRQDPGLDALAQSLSRLEDNLNAAPCYEQPYGYTNPMLVAARNELKLAQGMVREMQDGSPS